MQNIYKKFREKYRPKKVDVLFIGESPPLPEASRVRYFYNEKEDSPGRLYRKLAYALELKEPKSEGLQDFKDRNMWLTDIFDEPVKKVKPEKVKKHLDRLFKEINETNPPKIVTLLPERIQNKIFMYFLAKHLHHIKFLYLNPWALNKENLKKKLSRFVNGS